MGLLDRLFGKPKSCKEGGTMHGALRYYQNPRDTTCDDCGRVWDNRGRLLFVRDLEAEKKTPIPPQGGSGTAPPKSRVVEITPGPEWQIPPLVWEEEGGGAKVFQVMDIKSPESDPNAPPPKEFPPGVVPYDDKTDAMTFFHPGAIIGSPYRSKCSCPCHEPGRVMMHFRACCVPDHYCPPHLRTQEENS